MSFGNSPRAFQRSTWKASVSRRGCGEEKKARAAGCDDYVPKPFSPRELLAKIRQYLPE
jgi:DNA-binding response OmpR family regulator